MEIEFLQWLQEQAPIVVILLLLLWLIGTRYFKAMDKRVDELKQHADEVNKINYAQVQKLEKRADDCDQRHRLTESRYAEMHGKIMELIK